MKKIILTFCVCFSLICFACSKKTEEQLPSNPESVKNDSASEPETAPSALNTEESNVKKNGNSDNGIEVVNHESEKKVEKMTFSLKTQTYGIGKIDSRLEQAVNAFIASEIGEFNDTYGDDKDAEMNVSIRQETVRADKTGVDVVFKIDRFVTGTAHPSGDVLTFMFNTETGDEVSAVSLFESGALNRENVMGKCADSIVPMLGVGEDVRGDVEKALKDNAFEHVVRTGKGYKIYFAPEEIVGPYRQIIEVDLDTN